MSIQASVEEILEDIKKYPLAKVESLFHIRHEDGSVQFFEETLNPSVFARVVILKEGNMIPLDSNQSLEKIKNEEKFLLYIKSEGCSVCEADFPKVKEITDKNNYLSYYIQADEIPEAVGQLNLYTVPVVILFYNGKEIHRQARIIDFSELDYRIKQTL